MWNVFSFNREQEQEAEKLKARIEADPGEYDPILGHSYGEIAGMSRSLHKSQGMGAPERKGSQKNYLVTIAGEPAAKDIFEGIATTWDSIPRATPGTLLLTPTPQPFHPDPPTNTPPPP